MSGDCFIHRLDADNFILFAKENDEVILSLHGQAIGWFNNKRASFSFPVARHWINALLYKSPLAVPVATTSDGQRVLLHRDTLTWPVFYTTCDIHLGHTRRLFDWLFDEVLPLSKWP